MDTTRDTALLTVQLLALTTIFAGDLLGAVAVTTVGVTALFLALATHLVSATASLVAGVGRWHGRQDPLATTAR